MHNNFMTLYAEYFVNKEELNSILQSIGSVVYLNKCYYLVYSVDCEECLTFTKTRVGFKPYAFSQDEFNEKYKDENPSKVIHMHALPWNV